ncbi:MAG: FtsX-like permease family protein [Acidobacteria bacterium]|nr:FtsX-like permease family protein [Acidobacteriota bacterium]
MSFPWFIALRYLTARRKQAFISLISLVSILGVGVGVMALIIATALMTGVQGELRDRIVGATAHINVYKTADGGLLDVEAEAQKMQVEGVVGVAPVVVGQGMVVFNGQQAPLQLKGIDPPREVQVTDLGSSMTAGSLTALVAAPETGPEDEPIFDPILLGQDLADRLRVTVGDNVQIMTPEGVMTPLAMMPRLRRFHVVGIFKLGFYQFDANYGLIPMSVALDFLSQPGPDAMQLKVADLDEAPAIAERLRNSLGGAYLTEDWTELNASLYSALRLEKVAIALTIGLIVMVAALNIVASLVLLVMEKSRDIGILRTMGAPASAIRRMFLLQGLTIGAIGTGAGTLLGLLACWVSEHYRLFELPGDVYQITRLRFQVEPLDVLTIMASAMVICLVATLYPSRKAASLDPAEALRYQ